MKNNFHWSYMTLTIFIHVQFRRRNLGESSRSASLPAVSCSWKDKKRRWKYGIIFQHNQYQFFQIPLHGESTQIIEIFCQKIQHVPYFVGFASQTRNINFRRMDRSKHLEYLALEKNWGDLGRFEWIWGEEKMMTVGTKIAKASWKTLVGEHQTNFEQLHYIFVEIISLDWSSGEVNFGRD